MKQIRKPTHPGVYFKHTILDEREISIASAAVNLGVTKAILSDFVNGKAKCSYVMARRLAEATGTSAGVWIMMQANLDTWKAENMMLEISVTPF